MSSWRVVEGDWVEKLRELPDGSVDCCVTSPPYWGLRDYGTAEWEGGDGACTHLQPAPGPTGNKGNNGYNGTPYKDVCGKCGAVRVDRQLGLEKTPEEYVAKLVAGFREVRRVLADHGVLWLNLGDSYTSGGRDTHRTRVGYKQQTNRGMSGENDPARAPQPPGLKPKDLVGIPWRVAFALRADGWYLRSDIIWHKPNPMPESVTDRPTKAHEYVFLLTKAARYWYDADAIREPSSPATKCPKAPSQGAKTAANAAEFGVKPSFADAAVPYRPANRNARDVWSIATQAFAEAHFATFPEALVEPMIRAGCPSQVCCECGKPWVRVVERTQAGERFVSATVGRRPACSCPEGTPTRPGLVLDPFCGSGTVGVVCVREARRFLGIELNEQYADMARRRIGNEQPGLEGIA